MFEPASASAPPVALSCFGLLDWCCSLRHCPPAPIPACVLFDALRAAWRRHIPPPVASCCSMLSRLPRFACACSMRTGVGFAHTLLMLFPSVRSLACLLGNPQQSAILWLLACSGGLAIRTLLRAGTGRRGQLGCRRLRHHTMTPTVPSGVECAATVGHAAPWARPLIFPPSKPDADGFVGLWACTGGSVVRVAPCDARRNSCLRDKMAV